MKRLLLLALSFWVVTCSLFAGVVYEIETTLYSQSKPQTLQSTLSAEGRLVRVDQVLGSGARNSMIFRADRREMLVIDHDRKSYIVFDEETLLKLSRQLSEAQQQIERQLAGLPEEQRALAERMMKGRLPQKRSAKSAPSQVRNTGQRADRNGYPCVRYEVTRQGQKIRELWVTDWGRVSGGAEVRQIFIDMASFYRKLLENSPVGASMDENLFAELDQVEGFPVVTKIYENGKLESEGQLRSSQSRLLDPAEFEPPAGYKRRSMTGGR